MNALLAAQLSFPTIAEIAAATADHKAWALPLVAFVGFLKSTPVIAAFIPSTALFVALAAVYGAGGGAFVPLWLAATAGATIGDCVGFAFGYRYRSGIARLWPFCKSPELFSEGEALFARWGLLSVLFAKFVWGLRPFIPVIAGVYQMPFLLFFAVTNLASMVWAAIGMGAGFGILKMWG